jgi:hypothetical protein
MNKDKIIEKQLTRIAKLESMLREYTALMMQQKHEIADLKKKSKPLTVKQVKKIADSVCHDWDEEGLGHMYMADFAKAIEERHGIK